MRAGNSTQKSSNNELQWPQLHPQWILATTCLCCDGSAQPPLLTQGLIVVHSLPHNSDQNWVISDFLNKFIFYMEKWAWVHLQPLQLL